MCVVCNEIEIRIGDGRRRKSEFVYANARAIVQ